MIVLILAVRKSDPRRPLCPECTTHRYDRCFDVTRSTQGNRSRASVKDTIMTKPRVKKTSGQANEGEGSRTAARRYNAGVQKTIKEGHVAEKAREAARALNGAEGPSLRRAEAEAKRH